MIKLKLISFLVLMMTLLSCQSSSSGKVDNSDSAENLDLGSGAEAKRKLDSILKAAGPDAKITIRSKDTVLTSEWNLKKLNASELKEMNAAVLDSLIKTSGKKYTIIHFWAIWCKPCLNKFQETITAYQNINNADVILVSIDYNTEEQRKRILAYCKRQQVKLPYYINKMMGEQDAMGMESQRNLVKPYGILNCDGVPQDILINNKTKKGVFCSSDYKELLSKLK